jgi:predicted AAA+ superfamily ATPase
MRDEVLTFVQLQRAIAIDKLRRFVIRDNGQPYHARYLQSLIDKYIHDFSSSEQAIRWILIPGLRGTGKTTLMAQCAYKLLIDSSHPVLFFSLDEAAETIGATLFEILEAFEFLLGKRFERLTERVYIFIDEVQADENWAKILKTIYDRSDKIMLICSGSSALHLQTTADVLGRRAVRERLFPMSFTEYEFLAHNVSPINGLDDKISQALYKSSNATEVYEALKSVEPIVNEYWSRVDKLDWESYLKVGGLPFTLTLKNEYAVFKAIMTTIDKIVITDISKFKNFNVSTLTLGKRILALLVENDTISYNKISQLTNLSAAAVSDLIHMMVQAELIIGIPPQGSAVAMARKPTKNLFMSSTIRAAYYNITGLEATESTRRGKLLEDQVALTLYSKFSSYGNNSIRHDPDVNGADFILNFTDYRIAIEVGNGIKSTDQVKYSMDRFKCRYGIVIHGGRLLLSKEKDIVSIPHDYFSLS